MKEVDISEINALTKDRETSIRLYRSYRKKYPGREAEWIVQRVVTDLQRDRGVPTRSPHVRTRSNADGDTQLPGWFQKYSGLLGVLTFGIFQFLRMYGGDGFGDALDNQQTTQSSFNLLEPSLYQELESGAVVTIQNESPEPIKLTLKSKDESSTYIFTIPACTECSYYQAERVPESCPSRKYVETKAVVPGVYEATMDFMGSTRTGRGTWSIVDGWEHFGCYYSVYGENDIP